MDGIKFAGKELFVKCRRYRGSIDMSKNANRLKDITGQRFGRWLVLEFSQSLPKKFGSSTITMWKCRCDCGTIRDVIGGDLKSGKTNSCGCLKAEQWKERRTVHGKSGTKVHTTWTSMNQRCNTPSRKDYPLYGGRGITVCDRWHEFVNFYADMGDPPTPKHTLDRIDVNGNYEPSNCRWATMKEQSNNRGNNISITLEEKTHTIAEWSRIKGILAGTLQYRFWRGWSPEKILTPPVKQK